MAQKGSDGAAWALRGQCGRIAIRAYAERPCGFCAQNALTDIHYIT
jgi:hypothetical protein